MGREVNLHPAMVLVSFLVAGALLGLVGVLIAIPAAVVCATLMDELSPEAPPKMSLPEAGEGVRGRSRRPRAEQPGFGVGGPSLPKPYASLTVASRKRGGGGRQWGRR
jgi:hypothetical protein